MHGATIRIQILLLFFFFTFSKFVSVWNCLFVIEVPNKSCAGTYLHITLNLLHGCAHNFYSRFSQNCGKRLLVSSCLSVCPPTWNKSAPNGRIFTKLGIWGLFFLENLFRKFKFNPLNAELNPICHLLALLGAHHILHFSRIRVN